MKSNSMKTVHKLHRLNKGHGVVRSEEQDSCLFDHMAASIKWIRVKYHQNPPGVGLLEVIYVEADGQERKERYSSSIFH
jgi:hypothetical protein